MVNSIEPHPREFAGYDIIGDVHGCYDALVALLEKLGYSKRSGVYRHPSRQAIFVGDLVDRGPKIRETLHLVHDMVSSGAAGMVLGNHELNAVCYTTPVADNPQRYIRDHSERHYRQIKHTLDQFERYPDELDAFTNWFIEQPLFMEFEHFRVVHACWDHQLIEEFHAQYGRAHLDRHLLQQLTDTASLPRRFLDRLTRGTDMRLPDGESITGSDGYTRRFFRTKFWLENPKHYGEVVFQPDALPRHIHEREMSTQDRARILYYAKAEKPLFMGHYWRRGIPAPVAKNIACLDYSAVNGGHLVAYRLDDEPQVQHDKFVWVDAAPETQ